MSLKKMMYVVVGLALLSFSNAVSAETFSYPAALCNHNGLMPNAAGALGNWSGSTKKAFCGIPTSGLSATTNNVHVYVQSGVTCTLRRAYPNGDGSTYNPTSSTYFSGYERINFSQNVNVQLGQALGVECSVPDGKIITSIVVHFL